MGRTWRKKKQEGHQTASQMCCWTSRFDKNHDSSAYTDVDRAWMISMKQLITSRHPKYCQKLYPYFTYRCRRGPRILSLASKVYNWGYCLKTTRVWGTYDFASLLKVWSLYSSGPIILFHQPRFPRNKIIFLTKPPFGENLSCEVAIIWPDSYITIGFPNTWTPYISALKTGLPLSFCSLAPLAMAMCCFAAPYNHPGIRMISPQFVHVLIIFL